MIAKVGNSSHQAGLNLQSFGSYFCKLGKNVSFCMIWQLSKMQQYFSAWHIVQAVYSYLDMESGSLFFSVFFSLIASLRSSLRLELVYIFTFYPCLMRNGQLRMDEASAHILFQFSMKALLFWGREEGGGEGRRYGKGMEGKVGGCE